MVPNNEHLGSNREYMVGLVREFLEMSSWITANPRKLETGLRSNSAGIPYTLLLRIEAIGFPTFGLLL